MLMRKDLWEEAASLLSTLRTYVEIFSTQMRKKTSPVNTHFCLMLLYINCRSLVAGHQML